MVSQGGDEGGSYSEGWLLRNVDNHRQADGEEVTACVGCRSTRELRGWGRREGEG